MLRGTLAWRFHAVYTASAMSGDRQIRVLLEMTRKLVDAPDLPTALQHVTDAGLALLPSDHVSVRLFNADRTELLCGARSGSGRRTAPLSFRPGQGLVGWVADNGRVIHLGNAPDDPRFVRSSDQGFEVLSIVAAPMWSAGSVIGVLSASAHQANIFDSEHLDLVRLLANCAVPPIETARLRELALTDEQTQAYNRRYERPRLEEEMERARRYGEALSVLMLDLDHFKLVNDQFGHAVGDQVLEEFANRVRGATRRHDIFIRHGGEEFFLIMPNTDAEMAVNVAERILAQTRDTPFEVDSTDPIAQTVSGGVATWDGREGSESLKIRADAALYEAKNKGRDRVCVAQTAGDTDSPTSR